MLTRFTVSACAAAVAMAATLTPMTADALEFRFNKAEVGFRGVTVDRNDPLGVESMRTSAGAFDFDELDSAGNILRNFVAWCFDLDTTISTGQTYTYDEAPDMLDADPPYLAGAQERVQKLFDASYDPSAVLANAQASAGFQLAIWEVLYDDDFDLATGNFTATDSNALDEAGGYLTGVGTYAGGQNWILTTYDSANAQDLGVASAIPLPAAAWLLLGVTGGLVAAKRRSARRA